MENYLEEKKLYKHCMKMPPGQIGQEFWPKSTVGIFAWKLVDSIYTSPRKKWKIL